MRPTITLVDAHVHVHACTDVALMFDCAAGSFAATAAAVGARHWNGVLMLTEMRRDDWFSALASTRRFGDWEVQTPAQEPFALRVLSGARELLIVAGRQVVTSEGIELLALGTRALIPDGLDLELSLRAAAGNEALAVLPWGVGKWLGKRRRRVAAALLGPAAAGLPVVLPGDNGGRPWFWPRPREYSAAQRAGRALVSGSDPLPLTGEERRVGSFGFWLEGALSVDAPGSALRERLRNAAPRELTPFGRLQGPLRFLRNQFGVRLHKSGQQPTSEVRATPSPVDSPSPETPDVETSSADYARRFAGPAGRYLLAVQARAVQAALAGLAPGSALDVGGGHGQLVAPLRARGWRVTVHGTDPVCESNLRELHGERDCEFVCGPLERLPFPDRSFDLVIAVRLLSHVEAWPALLAEMSRVARRAVVIDYPNKAGLNALTPLLFGLKKSLEGNTRTYASFARAELAREFSRHGLHVEREVKQFFLPMVVHRMGRGAAPLRAAEALLRITGVTALAGSPVILRADRVD
jgi:ubiquinone/menaquinone biosynthesis C-methylase UbiE